MEVSALEKALKLGGYRFIAGCDEAGRGALAGPVVAASVVLSYDRLPRVLMDSKRMTKKRRELAAAEIKELAVACATSRIEPREIEKINILQASLKAMANAVGKLGIEVDCILVDGDLPGVLTRMEEAGVVGAIVIGIDNDTNSAASSLSGQHQNLAYTVGLHPTSNFPQDLVTSEFDAKKYLGAWFEGTNKPIGIGECGIDLHWDTNPLVVQQKVFKAQLELARELGLPAVIHARDADKEILDVISSVPGVDGVLHCFNGNPALLQFALNANSRGEDWYVSFAGNLTYPKAGELREAVLQIPVDRLLVETDSPFLVPQDMRGKRNEPAFVMYTVKRMASLLDFSFKAMSSLLLENTKRCFSWSG